jgi:hypothetical protein
LACGRQFQNGCRGKRLEKTIWYQYVYQRQTVSQLAGKYNKGRDWIREHLDNRPIIEQNHIHQSVVAIADITFFKRNFGFCVIRAPHLKKNLYTQEVQTESVDVYRQGRIDLEKYGYTIKAIVLDGRPGVRQLFIDVPIQLCHFHQKKIITRYLTNNPKLESGIELKKITATLCKTKEKDFTDALHDWHQKWSSFLKERTTDSMTGKWFYTHKRLRSAYRSLKNNLPYLFTYQKYPELNIPNTTNSLEGCFAYMKELVRVHRGANKTLKRKIIQEILTKSDPVFPY